MARKISLSELFWDGPAVPFAKSSLRLISTVRLQVQRGLSLAFVTSWNIYALRFQVNVATWGKVQLGKAARFDSLQTGKEAREETLLISISWQLGTEFPSFVSAQNCKYIIVYLLYGEGKGSNGSLKDHPANQIILHPIYFSVKERGHCPSQVLVPHENKLFLRQNHLWIIVHLALTLEIMDQFPI